ncbi:MAG: enoyl-CoA hydratase/isomerase family protein [Gammaproteobacteria bacterium]|nr:enoyl-CoA hydratase/isomerase family protein [Gammaproteobacteria bacterium]
MNEANVLLARDGAIATVTLNRPALHNAFDDRLIADLTDLLRELDADPGIRAVVLAASGKSFSAGADLGWMARMADYSEQDNYRDAMALAELMRVLDTLGKPTIARVQGAAYGGGVGLVACCDIAIAVESATFCFSEARLGIVPAVISPYCVRAIGARAAQRYFLTAERFDAATALRLGLVHELTSGEQLDVVIARVLADLAECGPAAQAACKDLVASVSGRPIDDELVSLTAELIAALRVSPEGQEGIRAFLDKRRPGWRH